MRIRYFEHGGNTWLIECWWWFLAVQVRLSALRSSFVVIQGVSHVCARSSSALSHGKHVSIFFIKIVPSLHNKQIMVANCYNWLTSNMFRPYSAIIRLTTVGVN